MTPTAGQAPASGLDAAHRAARRSPLALAIEATQSWLLAAQADDGHWCGELEGDTILETEYVILLHFLGRLDDPRVAKAARYVRRQQLPGGGWAIYPGGPPEVSGSVKAYFVLKIAGDDPAAAHMRRARQTILELGGIDACNSFTKIYLSICGQYDWWDCPAVPPEMMLLPRWLYFNLYEMSSWSRGIVVPLSIVWAMRPVRPVGPAHGIAELRLPAGTARERSERSAAGAGGGAAARTAADRPGTARPAAAAADSAGAEERTGGGLWAVNAARLAPASLRNLALGGASRFWRIFFHALDRLLKAGERLALRPFRRRALARAEAWVLERLEDSDGLGAIFPPIVNTIFALCSLGYSAEDPVVQSQIAELEKLEIEEDGALRLQPCFSSVWDTALALHALADAGLASEHAALQGARRWLLDREIRRTGDWSVKAPGAPPGGWCFEYRNAFYPDCDDTAEVLTALAGLSGGAGEPAALRGLAWLLAMQNEDGGWGAFDRACDKQVLTHVPFADHNALLDPSTADVTGRVVDSLCRLGLSPEEPVLARAVAFLRAEQESDGSWYGRWGCNYIYGTWLVLRALARCDAPAATRLSGSAVTADASCRRAAEWLLSCQNADGGWGESPRSYDDPAQKGKGASTAAQTAWALMGIFATGLAATPAAERGVGYLLRTQRDDGSWYDEPWTATGFPSVFYLRYHLYAVYFPLMALAEYRRLRDETFSTPTQHAYPLAVPARTAAIEGAVR
jgi:squalene-hopene/tetraprenyl-beta-curcumene cyclase